MNEERDAAWEAWLNEPERTEKVRTVARSLPPWGTYWLKETGQRARPIAYAEDGTLRAFCWYEWMGDAAEMLGHQVFGLDPADFVTTEPPSKPAPEPEPYDGVWITVTEPWPNWPKS